MTDKQIIKWLEAHQGCALVSDDDGRWAVSASGFQNVTAGKAADVQTTFFIAKKEWRTSIKKAVEAAAKAWK